MKDHITHPQGRHSYTWRFLALNRHDKNATPCRLSVEAATESEARRILAPHFILSLAARIPVTEGITISVTPAVYVDMNTPRNHADISRGREVRHA